MRIFLVDDESLALTLLEEKLRLIAEKRGEEFHLTSFLFSQEAFMYAEKQQPDAVFLDIHMPEISGIQAAELFQERYPSIQIVFLTAYDHYAVKAFELQALDYLLKPVQTDRLEKTIDRLVEEKRLSQLGNAPQAERVNKIYVFKTIRFGSDGRTPFTPTWRTAKTQELFAYLLHNRGEAVHKSALAELLLPDQEEKRALTQLYTFIYQIRQTVQKAGISIAIRSSSIQESYTLELGEDVVMETDEWEKALLLAGSGGQTALGRMRALLEAYSGDYLADYDYMWAESERERLRQLWLIYARRWVEQELENGGYEGALALLERVQAIDPYNEKECLALLKLYDRLGQVDKTVAHYGLIRARFEEELGLPIPGLLAEWYSQRFIEP